MDFPDTDKKATDLLTRIGNILRDHGGIESNVPLTSEYWALTGEYRKLMKDRESDTAAQHK